MPNPLEPGAILKCKLPLVPAGLFQGLFLTHQISSESKYMVSRRNNQQHFFFLFGTFPWSSTYTPCFTKPTGIKIQNSIGDALIDIFVLMSVDKNYFKNRLVLLWIWHVWKIWKRFAFFPSMKNYAVQWALKPQLSYPHLFFGLECVLFVNTSTELGVDTVLCLHWRWCMDTSMLFMKWIQEMTFISKCHDWVT